MAIGTPHVALFFSFICLPFFVHSATNKGDTKIIKGMFVFGSSSVDSGNNNFLDGTKAKGDYSPYGIDFPEGVTGRFTNGKNMVDVLCEKLKLPTFMPPFTNPSTKGPKIVNGVNFASGGSGISDDTGTAVVGKVITLSQQMKNFEKTLCELEAQLGQKGSEFLPNYLFVMGFGGNDFTLNYFLPRGDKSFPPLDSFVTNLTVSLSDQLKKLYDFGGRKFVITSVNPVGCTPAVINALKHGNECVLPVNKAVLLFNSKLKNLVDVLKKQMPCSEIIYVDLYKIINDIYESPCSRGFKETKMSCCELGDGAACEEKGKVCEDRNSYVYFDGMHTTEAVNIQIATKAFSSNDPLEVYPFNISRLAGVAV